MYDFEVCFHLKDSNICGNLFCDAHEKVLSFGYVLRHFPDSVPNATIYLNNVLVPPCPDACPYTGMPEETLFCELWNELQNMTGMCCFDANLIRK